MSASKMSASASTLTLLFVNFLYFIGIYLKRYLAQGAVEIAQTVKRLVDESNKNAGRT